jgi:hypothetical protein
MLTRAANMGQNQREITTAYRHLLRHALRAVQYSKPARYVIRDRLRDSFRNNAADTFDATKLDRTLQFLQAATSSKGLAHKMLKNFNHVWWQRAKLPWEPV